jgi:hypothetical protein
VQHPYIGHVPYCICTCIQARSKEVGSDPAGSCLRAFKSRHVHPAYVSKPGQRKSVKVRLAQPSRVQIASYAHTLQGARGAMVSAPCLYRGGSRFKPGRAYTSMYEYPSQVKGGSVKSFCVRASSVRIRSHTHTHTSMVARVRSKGADLKSAAFTRRRVSSNLAPRT